MLILSGVTISSVLGDNGIIEQAKRAAELTKRSTVVSSVQLDILMEEMEGKITQEKLEGILNKYGTTEKNDPENPDNVTGLKVEGVTDSIPIAELYPEGLTGGGENPPDDTVAKGKLVEGTNKTYTDDTGTAVIPIGFCVVKDSTVTPSDVNTVESGLVISDVADDDLDNSKHGNQFVWIPVNYDNFHLIEGFLGGKKQTYLSAASNPSREAGASKTEVLPGKPKAANTVLGTDESVAMYKSVKDNGGFYIARFEAGIAGTTQSIETDDIDKLTPDGTVKPVSQKGVGVWNFIPWGGTTTAEATDGLTGNDKANGAVKVARSMYNNPISGSTSSKTNVKSTLCYGVQWDAALNFIDPSYINGTSTGFVKNSNGMGNYSGVIATTGKNTAYQQKHIYDLAGNVYEWTMEAYSSNERVVRGGSYYDIGSAYPSSNRSSLTPDTDSLPRRPGSGSRQLHQLLWFPCSFVFVTMFEESKFKIHMISS